MYKGFCCRTWCFFITRTLMVLELWISKPAECRGTWNPAERPWGTVEAPVAAASLPGLGPEDSRRAMLWAGQGPGCEVWTRASLKAPLGPAHGRLLPLLEPKRLPSLGWAGKAAWLGWIPRTAGGGAGPLPVGLRRMEARKPWQSRAHSLVREQQEWTVIHVTAKTETQSETQHSSMYAQNRSCFYACCLNNNNDNTGTMYNSTEQPADVASPPRAPTGCPAWSATLPSPPRNTDPALTREHVTPPPSWPHWFLYGSRWEGCGDRKGPRMRGLSAAQEEPRKPPLSPVL